MRGGAWAPALSPRRTRQRTWKGVGGAGWAAAEAAGLAAPPLPGTAPGRRASPARGYNEVGERVRGRAGRDPPRGSAREGGAGV